jgi:hypothetical protein
MAFDTWKHRRRLTYIAFFSMIVLTAGVFLAAPWLAPATLDALAAYYGAYMLSMTGVLGAYFGFATIDDKSKRQNGHKITPGPDEQIG